MTQAPPSPLPAPFDQGDTEQAQHAMEAGCTDPVTVANVLAVDRDLQLETTLRPRLRRHVAPHELDRLEQQLDAKRKQHRELVT